VVSSSSLKALGSKSNHFFNPYKNGKRKRKVYNQCCKYQIIKIQIPNLVEVVSRNLILQEENAE